MADHRHEPYDIYGTAATTGDVERIGSQANGLREDLSAAESRIYDLESDRWLRDEIDDLKERVSTLQAVFSAHLAAGKAGG